MNPLSKRASLVLGVLAFVGLYNWVYITWLHPNFEYFGFSFDDPPWEYVSLGVILSAIPALWMPIVLRRPSQLILWVLYLTVFIPSMFVPTYAAYRPLPQIASLMVVLFLGFCILSAGSTARLCPLPSLNIPKATMLPILLLATVLLMSWVVVVFAGHFQLVSFGEVYQGIRYRGAEIAQGTGVGYAVMWLAGVLHPFLMIWGMIHRRFWFVLIGALGQVVLYSTAGLKIILLSTVLLPLFFLLLNRKNPQFGLLITWGTVLVFLLLNTVNLVVDDIGQSHFMLSALVFLRSFGLTGLTTAQYQDFFAEHPNTYFSHVKGLNLFVDYPYQGPIGKEVGYFYSSSLDYNANAHMWAMDGLAGSGLSGVIIISILCALVFWIMDSAAEGHRPVFASMMVCFASFNLSNVSLFTSLFSGGLAIIILILYVFPREQIAGDEETLDDDSPSIEPPAQFHHRPSMGIASTRRLIRKLH